MASLTIDYPPEILFALDQEPGEFALSAVGRLDLLQALFGEVLIPPAVRAEFLAVDSEQRQAELDAAPWVRCVALEVPKRALSYSGLDTGEAEVLALAEETDARLVVIDERKARRYAPAAGASALRLIDKLCGLPSDGKQDLSRAQ